MLAIQWRWVNIYHHPVTTDDTKKIKAIKPKIERLPAVFFCGFFVLKAQSFQLGFALTG